MKAKVTKLNFKFSQHHIHLDHLVQAAIAHLSYACVRVCVRALRI